MADAQANININLNASDALAQLKILQRQISQFHQSMAVGGAAARAESAQLAQTLINNVNASGKFSASIQRTLTTTESFTNALEKNKLSMGQYFKYGMASSRTFGKVFGSEFATINKVARERVKTLQTQFVQLGRDANGAMQSIAIRPLRLDMQNLGTQVMMTAQKQQIFNQLLKQGSTNLLNFGKNTQWAGRQLMVGFTIPLTIMGTTAAKEFQKMEEQAVKFRRVYGDMFTTDAETEKALDNVRQLADEFTKYGIAVEKTIGLAAKVAQMGNVGQDMIAQVTQATRLAVLGGLEQEEALDTTISLTNAFGIAAEDLAGKIAFLNAAENQTILAIEDFNEAIPKAGSVVQQLGGDVEDLAFMLTAMREGGVNASQAANAIKSSLGRMINPTEAAKKELAGFGIDVVGIVERNVGNLRATIMELGVELEQLDPLNRARAIETLFGKFQFARMSTMFQNIVKDGSQARKVLDLTSNSVEELAILAERELARVENSVSFKFQKQIEKLQAALAPIGGEFIKAITPIIEGATKILKWFNGMSDGAKQFAVITIAAIGVIAPTFLMLFGLVANGLANFIKGISKVGSFLNLLSGQSKLVGGSFSYMTQEQIQAQAVSASLEQTHQRLFQAFTSERVAVDALADAYRRATSAMAGLSAAAGGAATGAAAAGAAGNYNPFRPPQKYADGVVMVPGPRGAGDIVPAMLSPGEAVIPAKETAKYLPLIQGIVSDTLPGYSNSNIDQITRTLGGKTFNVRGGTDVSRLDVKLARLEGAEGTAPGVTKLVANELGDAALSVAALDNAIKRVNQSADNFVRIVQTLPEAGAPESKQGVIASHGSSQVKYTPEQTKQIASQLPEGSDIRARMEAASDSGRGSTGYSELVFGETVAGNENILSGEERAKFWRENPEITSANLRESGYLNFDDKETGEQQKLDYADFTERVAVGLEAAGERAVSESEFQNIVADSLKNMTEGAAREGMLAASSEVKSVAIEGERKASGERDKRRFELPPGQAIIGEDVSASQTNKAPYQSHTKKIRQAYSEAADEATRDIVRDRAKDIPVVDSNQEALAELDGVSEDLNQKMVGIGEAAADGLAGGTEQKLEIKSPSRRMFRLGEAAADGLAQGFEAGMSDEKNSLAPPTPPSLDESQPSGKVASMRRRIGGFVEKGVDKAVQTKPGQKAMQFFADATGNDIVDSQGNLVASAKELSTSTTEAARNVDNLNDSIDETSQEAGQAAADINSDIARDADGNPILGADGQPLTNKQIKKEKARQRRQNISSKALVGLGAVTAGLGAATQLNVEMFGVNIGEAAMKLLPFAGGLTAIAPMLLALPLPLAALVAVIGAGVATWMIYNKKLKEATEKARDLAVGLGVGSDAIQKFAEFAGTVSATELMNRQRQIPGIPIAAGRSEFGESFIGSEQGQEYVKTVEEGIADVGKSEVIDKLGLQLATAIASNVLTEEQAAGIAVELGRAIGDLSLGISVAAKVSSFIGPNGESEPLTIEVYGKLIEASTKDVEQTLDELMTKVLDARAKTGFFDFSKEELQAGLAAGILGQAEQVQQVLDAQQLQTENRVKALQEEGRQLAENGKQEEANAKFAEAKEAQTKGEEQRVALLAKQQELLAGTSTYMQEISDLADMAAALGDPQDIGRFSYDQQEVESATEELRNFLSEFDRLNDDVDFGDLAGKSLYDLQNLYRENNIQIDGLSNKQKAFNSTLEEMGNIIKDRLGEDSETWNKVNQIITNGDLEFDVKYNLVVGIGAGAYDISDVEDYLNGASEAAMDAVTKVQTSLGMGAGQTLMQIYGNLADNPEIADAFAVDIGAKVDAGEIQEAQELLDVLGGLSAYDAGPITADVIFNTYLNDEDKLNRMREALAELETLFAQKAGADGKISYDLVVSQQIIQSESALAAFKADAEYFNSLDPFQQFLYVRTLLTVEDTFDTTEYGAWLAKNPSLRRNIIEGRVNAGTGISMYLSETTRDIVGNALNLPTTTEEEGPAGPEGSGSGGPTGSILDEIVKSSRDFGNIGQELTTGWEESLNAILGMVDGVAFGVNGLANQLRRVNVPETLIDKFLGMPPEEWEKAKKDLFVVDETGNIAGTTAAGEKVVQAQSQATIAEEVNNIESQIATTEDQIDAFDRLVASGASVELAYEMIQNKALATAIATAKNTEQVNRLIKAQKELKELQDELEEINEEEQRKKRISEAIEEMNKKFEDQVKALNKIRAAADEYTDAQISAIFQNQDLMSLFLEPNINPKALQQALDNAEKQAELELQIKLLTVEGKAGVVNDAFAKAQEALSAEQQRIELEFDLAVSGQQDIIDRAQEEIDSINYVIDDYQAGLTEIQNQEDLINETYDKRFEALDKIAQINDKISAQQQNQLDLAEALSRGDIAAAAQAAQKMRDQEQQDSIESQRELLEQRQKAEIDSIKSTSGLTRDELEKQIDLLENRIFQIEEQRLEPAQEYVRLAELRKQEEIDSLSVLGKTNEEWNRLQNAIDVARTRNYKFVNELQDSFAQYPSLLASYLEGEPLPAPPQLPPPPPPPSRGGGKPSKWEGEMAGPKGREARREARLAVWARKRARGVPGFSGGGYVARMAMGGRVKGYPMGGLIPYKNAGGFFKSLGSDTVPAMLTPGEFVVRRPAVSEFGVDNLEKINRGTYNDGSVYNYNLAVNVKSDANPEQIANTVMRELKRVDSQRIRNNRY